MTRILALTLTILAACLYDPDDRCGADQVLSENGVCRCEEGMVAIDARCVPCGEHEVAAGDHCSCEDGYARDATGACVPAAEVGDAWPTGQGDACESATDCEGNQAAYCESFFLHQCLVEGCIAEGAAPCSDGWLCCDFTGVAGISVCVDGALLEGGTCPAL